MFGRGKNVTLMKPKKLHSLEYLKYLYSTLQKNPIVSDQNRELIVEAVRLIAEILIWGDQNDSTVMDFFLEKSMLDEFMKYLRQDCGRLLCVQVLQALNILFENISNQTAIYYLLSSNHTNEIITHRFDFSDEEVVAYYVSFLKTLSFRLNCHTINFFYFEQRREFNLYVEAIKLFCHPENMVRIAVRTITLNVHRVKDEGALEFIHHQTSVPYFSYLVWSIGNTVLDIDALLRSDVGSQSYSKLGDLMAEHVDHLHYVNDLLSLDIEAVNDVLCDQLLHRLLIPLHVFSLTKRCKRLMHKTGVSRPQVCNPVATLMLLHVYLIIGNPDLMRILTEAIFLGDPTLTDSVPRCNRHSPSTEAANDNADHDAFGERSEDEDIHSDTEALLCEVNPAMRIAESLVAATLTLRSARAAKPGARLLAYMDSGRYLNRQIAFLQPNESLEASLKHAKQVTPSLLASVWPSSLEPLTLSGQPKKTSDTLDIATEPTKEELCQATDSSIHPSTNRDSANVNCGIPFEEQGHTSVPNDSKQHSQINSFVSEMSAPQLPSDDVSNNSLSSAESNRDDTVRHSNYSFKLQGRPFLRALYRALEVGPGTDYDTLFTLLLLQAMRANKGLDQETLRYLHISSPKNNVYPKYDDILVGKLLDIICDGCKSGSRVRLITLHVTMQLLTELVCHVSAGCQLSDEHFAQLVSAREEAMMVLRSYFQNDAIFLDLFEYELRNIRHIRIPLQKMAMDFDLLLPSLMDSVLPDKQSSPTHASSLSSPRCPGRESQHVWTRSEQFKHLPQSHFEHTQHAVGAYLLVHIWLESLLRVRSDEGSPVPKLVSATTNSNSDCLFSSKLPVDLTVVPGLAGLGDVPDPKITLVHKAGDKLDLSSEALIGCTVEISGSHEKRFLVNYSQQLVLVEPDSKQMGWGVITFIGPLQDLEAVYDPADSRCLHVNINPPGYLSSAANFDTPGNYTGRVAFKPLFCARFLFEDHIRCMTARQMLIRGRELARQTKLRKIATMLDFSPQYIRDSFSGVGTGYGSAATFFDLEPSGRGVSHGRMGTAHISSASNPADLSSGWSSRGLTSTISKQHAANHDPGAFLLERQSRIRANRSYPDGDLSEGRLPLITLAGRSHRSGIRQTQVDKIGANPQVEPPPTGPYQGKSNSLQFHNQPLLHQSISSALQTPKFTILPPPEEGEQPVSVSSPPSQPASTTSNDPMNRFDTEKQLP